MSVVVFEHHLIVVHDVINEGNDRSRLSAMSKKAKAAPDHPVGT